MKETINTDRIEAFVQQIAKSGNSLLHNAARLSVTTHEEKQFFEELIHQQKQTNVQIIPNLLLKKYEDIRNSLL